MLEAAAERALVERARSSSRRERAAAFDALFTSLREPTLRLCLNLLGDTAEAEDALQETFFAVHRALPAFRGDARLSTWVYRIALRAALRIRGRRKAHDELPVSAAAPGQHPDEQAATRQRARRVAAAMEQLTLEQRAVLSLFAVDGLSHEQIADVLGVPEGTVWSRLHAARKRVAAAMGEP